MTKTPQAWEVPQHKRTCHGDFVKQNDDDQQPTGRCVDDHDSDHSTLDPAAISLN